MGADLIVFIVKGPATISPEATAEAIKAAEKVSSFVKQITEKAYDDDNDEDQVWEELMEAWETTPLAHLNVDYFDDFSDLERLEVDAKEVVEEFVEHWNSGELFRDESTRPDPDDETQRIHVAGELSWGDEPEGNGYQALKQLSDLNAFKALGFR